MELLGDLEVLVTAVLITFEGKYADLPEYFPATIPTNSPERFNNMVPGTESSKTTSVFISEYIPLEVNPSVRNDKAETIPVEITSAFEPPMAMIV